MNQLKPLESMIFTIRNHKVIIDADLAALYDVPTKALNQAIKRNEDRFPPDFVFRLTEKERLEVVTSCDHLAHGLHRAWGHYGSHRPEQPTSRLDERLCRASICAYA